MFSLSSEVSEQSSAGRMKVKLETRIGGGRESEKICDTKVLSFVFPTTFPLVFSQKWEGGERVKLGKRNRLTSFFF